MDTPHPGLIARASRGDRQAFAELVELLHPRALRFAHRMLGDPLDAEDAVQETFIRVWNALPRFREGAPFDPWFFKVLGNRCRTLIDRQRRQMTQTLETELPAPPHVAQPDHDWNEEVGRALAQLPTDQREAFLMRHVEGLTYEEISEVTGAGLSALRMRVKRAMDALRVQLAGVANA